MLATCLLVVHDAVRSRQHQVTELSGREQVRAELLDLVDFDIESGGDNTTLVDSAKELDDDFARAVIIHDFEVADVSSPLHALQELDDDLRRWTDENLPASPLLSVDEGFQAIC